MSNQKILLNNAIQARQHRLHPHPYQEQDPVPGHPAQFWGTYSVTDRITGQTITRDGEYCSNKRDAKESAAEQMRLYIEKHYPL
jgi:hypothetical protein